MNLLSLQSHVAYGHVGNSAAVFPLQRLGVEVWPVHTVQFSNHPGYGQWRGRVLEADAIRDVVQGIEERGVLGECDGVLSGYLGSVEVGEAVIDAVARVKAANPTAFYCCDPVIGDVEPGVFVCDGVPEFIRDCAVPAADMLAPNLFELEHLTGRDSRTLAGVLAAIDRLHRQGPRIVLVTSVQGDDTPGNAVDLVASSGDARYRVRTPRLPLPFNGAGDVIAGLFLVHFLREGSISLALSLAASSTYGLVCRTAEVGSRELLLIEAQDEFVAPTNEFKAERL